jgi:hypothetical protein
MASGEAKSDSRGESCTHKERHVTEHYPNATWDSLAAVPSSGDTVVLIVMEGCVGR